MQVNQYSFCKRLHEQEIMELSSLSLAILVGREIRSKIFYILTLGICVLSMKFYLPG